MVGHSRIALDPSVRCKKTEIGDTVHGSPLRYSIATLVYRQSKPVPIINVFELQDPSGKCLLDFDHIQSIPEFYANSQSRQCGP